MIFEVNFHITNFAIDLLWFFFFLDYFRNRWRCCDRNQVEVFWHSTTSNSNVCSQDWVSLCGLRIWKSLPVPGQYLHLWRNCQNCYRWTLVWIDLLCPFDIVPIPKFVFMWNASSQPFLSILLIHNVGLFTDCSFGWWWWWTRI